MNNWTGIGRLTKDVELKYAGENPIGKFTIAIDDGYGEKKKTNFIPIVCFGKQAENAERYLAKGKRCAVRGKIQTGSYKNKEGVTIYTTDVIADDIEYLENKSESNSEQREYRQEQKAGIPEGFEEVKTYATLEEADDIPF